jgi:hypothetical protein
MVSWPPLDSYILEFYCLFHREAPAKEGAGVDVVLAHLVLGGLDSIVAIELSIAAGTYALISS